MKLLDSGVNTMIDEQEKLGGENTALTPEANGTQEPTQTEVESKEEKVVENVKEPEKTFTQSEVNSIIQERLKEKDKSLLKKLGLETFDGISEKLQKSNDYDALLARKNELETELLFRNNNIASSKIDDIKYLFKGKGLELNAENLKKELETHNEWLNSSDMPNVKIGAKSEKESNETTEEAILKKYFDI
ncbi:MAG TPA: hypothetical protein DD377_03700 [Firmicutes bacterium]|nr:hypothetical protein [Bacillota bacterium]